MDKQPDEILIHILGKLKGIDAVRALRVCKKWKNLMENIVLYKSITPSFEECVIESDYYHFRKYTGIKPDKTQIKFIRLADDKILMNHFRVIPNPNRLLLVYSFEGNFSAVRYLVEKGADIHYDNEHALRYSATKGHFALVQYLVENGADINADNDCALRNSAYNGHLEVVKYLVENGANIHADNEFAFLHSIICGHLEVVKYLVEKGADIHAKNDNALKWSAEDGYTDIVLYLISKGADVNVLSDKLRKKYQKSQSKKPRSKKPRSKKKQ